MDSLKGGEIILRKGRGFLSEVIVELTGEDLQYSHAGIIIKSDTSLFIIHTLSNEVSNIDGVQTSSIPHFLEDVSDSSLCILKPNVSPTQQLLIQKSALNYLKEQAPFDYAFNNETKDKLHCMELVHDVILTGINKELIIPTKKIGVSFYPFSTFFNTPNFEILYEMKPHSKHFKIK